MGYPALNKMKTVLGYKIAAKNPDACVGDESRFFI